MKKVADYLRSLLNGLVLISEAHPITLQQCREIGFSAKAIAPLVAKPNSKAIAKQAMADLSNSRTTLLTIAEPE